jgi:membrane-bound lytic murein transglycosylase F
MHRHRTSTCRAPSRVKKKRAAAALFAVSTLLLVSCAPPPPTLDRVRARGELRIVTLNSPTSYYEGAHGPEGLEYELAKAFAKDLGVKLKMYSAPHIRAMQTELDTGRADIAAAQLSADTGWSRVGIGANVYEHIPQYVVFRRGNPRPRSTIQIESAKLSVRAGSPQEGLLQRLKNTVAPTLEWMETAPRAADPLEDVQNGQVDYAVVDAREFSYSRHLYPDILVGFTLPEKRPVQWVVRRGAPDLLASVNRFFDSISKSGELARLQNEATGSTHRFEYLESLRFQEHITARLTLYRDYFEEASAQTGVDWRLLAAIGYQESKWNPEAQSANGALGLMMLTASTAESLGVSDRADPRQSILAGAKYFIEVRDKVPERIPEPDRTWLAVASYNVGFGHLEDARVVTQIRGKNPDSWNDVRESLPLLAQEKWYSRVKRGYARGWEPAQFVDRIQRFLKLLEWQGTEALDWTRRTPEPPPLVRAVQSPHGES